ncbi:hypothetical protein ES703_100519 [subsurface metagenome]
MGEAKETRQSSLEIEQMAEQRAKHRAYAARWNLDIAVFAFAVLIIVIILLFQGVRIGIVAPVAVFGLAMVWLCGYWQGKQLYQRFYDEELFILEREWRKGDKESEEETVEELIQKALRERWR